MHQPGSKLSQHIPTSFACPPDTSPPSRPPTPANAPCPWTRRSARQHSLASPAALIAAASLSTLLYIVWVGGLRGERAPLRRHRRISQGHSTTRALPEGWWRQQLYDPHAAIPMRLWQTYK